MGCCCTLNLAEISASCSGRSAANPGRSVSCSGVGQDESAKAEEGFEAVAFGLDRRFLVAAGLQCIRRWQVGGWGWGLGVCSGGLRRRCDLQFCQCGGDLIAHPDFIHFIQQALLHRWI